MNEQLRRASVSTRRSATACALSERPRALVAARGGALAITIATSTRGRDRRPRDSRSLRSRDRARLVLSRPRTSRRSRSPRISTARRARDATSARISRLEPSGPQSQIIRLADLLLDPDRAGVDRRDRARRHAPGRAACARRRRCCATFPTRAEMIVRIARALAARPEQPCGEAVTRPVRAHSRDWTDCSSADICATRSA